MRRRNGFGTLASPETSEGEWVSDKLGVGRCARERRDLRGAASRASSVGGACRGPTVPCVGGWKAGRVHGEGCYTDTDKVEWKGAFLAGKHCNGKARTCVVSRSRLRIHGGTRVGEGEST